jgi:amino acid transporter
VSTFGTTNGAILTGPRVTQAMASDGLLWKPLGGLDPRRGSPTLALWIQAVLSCLWLKAASGFDDVSGWFVTTSWLFYAVTTATIFVQRGREGRGEQGVATYRTPLYPLTPAVFLLVTAAIIWSDFSNSGAIPHTVIPRAMAGVLIAATGFPVYFLWRASRRA